MAKGPGFFSDIGKKSKGEYLTFVLVRLHRAFLGAPENFWNEAWGPVHCVWFFDRRMLLAAPG